ncbi:MAG: sulfur globule family protein [Clostridia bacterium]|nr:sulfur globule family protein [Clostridia bacterium]
MEVYNLYRQLFDSLRQINYNSSSKLGASSTLLLYSLGIAFLVWAVFYLFQAFGLYAMAKKQGLKRKALAFIPFANIYYMGKITGECRFFARKVKHIGLYAMLVQILVSVAACLTVAAEIYLYTTYGEPTRYDTTTELGVILGSPVWEGATSGLGKAAVWYLNYGELLFVSTFGLVYEILMLVLVIALFKKYTMRGYFPLSILSVFVPFSRYIIIFVLRNREPIDYEAIMRARREAYIRQQQQYQNRYGNPYGNPYNNPYGYGNPYGNPYGGQSNGQNQNSAPPKQEDPFEEFSSSDGGGNTQSGDENSDGFFD